MWYVIRLGWGTYFGPYASVAEANERARVWNGGVPGDFAVEWREVLP